MKSFCPTIVNLFLFPRFSVPPEANSCLQNIHSSIGFAYSSIAHMTPSRGKHELRIVLEIHVQTKVYMFSKNESSFLSQMRNRRIVRANGATKIQTGFISTLY